MRTASPARSVASSLPREKNARLSPSGEKNGFEAPSVPRSLRGSGRVESANPQRRLTGLVLRHEGEVSACRGGHASGHDRRPRRRCLFDANGRWARTVGEEAPVSRCGCDCQQHGRCRSHAVARARGEARPNDGYLERPRLGDALRRSRHRLTVGFDSRHEPVATPRNCLDERCVRRIVSERPANDRDRMDQAVVRHGDVAPRRGDELVFLDNPMPVVHQVRQRVECPWR